jgi:hypothetical protein
MCSLSNNCRNGASGCVNDERGTQPQLEGENKMIRALIPALILFATTGCILYTDSDDVRTDPNPDPIINFSPIVLGAEAGCYWDSYYYDDIWYFEAEVDDPDTPYDVVEVWADIYDEWDGSWVDSFELYPTDDPYLWYSDWLGSSTYLDCFYNYYSVDFVAYDTYEDTDTLTVWAE